MPYLHGVWHILSAIAAYTSIVLFQYFNAIEEYAQFRPEIMYWPEKFFATRKPWFELLAIPYVHFNNNIAYKHGDGGENGYIKWNDDDEHKRRIHSKNNDHNNQIKLNNNNKRR